MPHLDEYCHVFYEWPLNAVLHKKWARDRFVENTAPWKMGPKLTISLQTKLLVILHYSKSFKCRRSNQNTGKMYKIIWEFLKRFSFLWLSKTSLTRRATFEVIFIYRPYKIVVIVVWDDRTTGNVNPWFCTLSPYAIHQSIGEACNMFCEIGSKQENCKDQMMTTLKHTTK